MPKLDLNGPFDLKDAVIDTKINANAIGNFTIGFMNDSGKFVVKVIGRSDRDLQGDLKSARLFRRNALQDPRPQQSG